MTQYSLFGSEAAEPTSADLDGLLLCGAQWVRGRDGARLSVILGESGADQWRADAVRTAFTRLGIDAGEDTVIPAAGGLAVRTRFTEALVDHAARWTRGARQGVPAGFELTAGGLRLWTAAAGRSDESGYLLCTAAAGAHSQSLQRASVSLHDAAGAQLARLGVAGASLTRHAAGQRPGWRITSARRLRRLTELVGPAPDPRADWPGADRAGELRSAT